MSVARRVESCESPASFFSPLKQSAEALQVNIIKKKIKWKEEDGDGGKGDRSFVIVRSLRNALPVHCFLVNAQFSRRECLIQDVSLFSFAPESGFDRVKARSRENGCVPILCARFLLPPVHALLCGCARLACPRVNEKLGARLLRLDG